MGAYTCVCVCVCRVRVPSACVIVRTVGMDSIQYASTTSSGTRRSIIVAQTHARRPPYLRRCQRTQHMTHNRRICGNAHETMLRPRHCEQFFVLSSQVRDEAADDAAGHHAKRVEC